MSHSEVLKRFEAYFPNLSGDAMDVWFANGKNSIRVRLRNRQEFIFTFHGDKDWKLETIESFMKTMRGARKR